MPGGLIISALEFFYTNLDLAFKVGRLNLIMYACIVFV